MGRTFNSRHSFWGYLPHTTAARLPPLHLHRLHTEGTPHFFLPETRLQREVSHGHTCGGAGGPATPHGLPSGCPFIQNLGHSCATTPTTEGRILCLLACSTSWRHFLQALGLSEGLAAAYLHRCRKECSCLAAPRRHAALPPLLPTWVLFWYSLGGAGRPSGSIRSCLPSSSPLPGGGGGGGR